MGQSTSCRDCQTTAETAADEDLYHELRRNPIPFEIADEARRLVAKGLIRCTDCDEREQGAAMMRDRIAKAGGVFNTLPTPDDEEPF